MAKKYSFGFESGTLSLIGRICRIRIWRRSMDYRIRQIKEKEYPLLAAFLYKAIFIPEGVEAPPKSIINNPELQVYVSDFGTQRHDRALVAEVDGNIDGAVSDNLSRT